MLSLVAAGAATLQAPSVREALSGVFGSVSLTAWICLLLPQLITNYKTKSADALSMKFLFIWLIGDVANLSGALLTDLAPSTIALAIYFCVADIILIAQCTYYNSINARRRTARSEHNHHHHHHHHHRRRPSATAEARQDSPSTSAAQPTEEDPLLSPHHHRHHRRRDSNASGLDPLAGIVTGSSEHGGGGNGSSAWVYNTVSLLAVWVVGAAGWFISYKMGAWEVPGMPGEDGDGGLAGSGPVRAVGIGLGYFSAVCYLCARIPQIIKNYREKSCEGLSLLFFLLSLTGNLTYGASVIAYDQHADYLIRALPWLLGSLGTMVEDCIIFVQFHLYSPKRKAKVVGAA